MARPSGPKTRCNGEWTGSYVCPRYGYLMVYTERGRGRIPKRAHRVIWERYIGKIPEGYHIDHVNGDRLDNRLENLRLATNQENSRNIKIKPMTNIDKRGNSYRVRLMIDGKVAYTESFSNLLEAQRERNKMRKYLFKEFWGNNGET